MAITHLSLMVTTVVRGTAQIKQLQGGLAALSGVAITTGIAIAGLAAAFAGLAMKEAIKKSMELSDELQALKAATGATSEEFAKMKELGFELGESMGAFTTPEAIEAMRILGYAGFTTNQILEATPQVLKLSSAGMVDLATATDIVASSVKSFGLDASETTRIVDVMTKTFISTNTMVDQLGEAMTYVNPVAAAAGMSFEDVATSLGILANSGIKASKAGTSMRAILIRLQAPTTQARQALNDLNVELFEMTPTAMELNNMIIKQTSEFRELEMQMEANKLASKELSSEMDKLSLDESKNALQIMKIRDKAADEKRDLTEEEIAMIDKLEAANNDLAISQKEISIQQKELSIEASKQKDSYDDLKTSIEDNNEALNGSMGSLKDMESIIKEFDSAMQGMSDSEKAAALNAIFGRRAIASFQVLMGSIEKNTSDASTSFEELSESLHNAGGTADEVFETMEQGTGKQWRQFTSAVDTLMIEIGDQLAPVLIELVGIFKEMMPILSGTLIPVFRLMGSVLKALTPVFQYLSDFAKEYQEELKLIAWALMIVLGGPLILLIAQIALFTAVLVGLTMVTAVVIRKVRELAGWLKDKLAPVVDIVKQEFDEFRYAVSIVIDFLTWLEEKIGINDLVMKTFTKTVSLLVSAVTFLGNVIKDYVIDRVDEAMTHFDTFKEKLASFEEMLIELREKFIDMIPDQVFDMLDKLKGLIDKIGDGIAYVKEGIGKIPDVKVPGSEGTVGDLIKGIPGFAGGGRVDSPTLAWVAEEEPEWIIPESQVKKKATAASGKTFVSNDTYVFNPTIQGEMSETMLDQMYTMFVQKIEDHKRNKSKNAFAEVGY